MNTWRESTAVLMEAKQKEKKMKSSHQCLQLSHPHRCLPWPPQRARVASLVPWQALPQVTCLIMQIPSLILPSHACHLDLNSTLISRLWRDEAGAFLGRPLFVCLVLFVEEAVDPLILVGDGAVVEANVEAGRRTVGLLTACNSLSSSKT